jgi:hypothetical protein
LTSPITKDICAGVWAGVPQLAKRIWKAGTEARFRKAPFKNGSTQIPKLVNVLLGISTPLLMMMIEGKTHLLYSANPF